MAAPRSADDPFAPTRFSPTPELVRIAVVVLAVAGAAGLWMGAAEALQNRPLRTTPPITESRPTPAAATASPVTAVSHAAPSPVAKEATAGSKPDPKPEPAQPETLAAGPVAVDAAAEAAGPAGPDAGNRIAAPAEPVVTDRPDLAPATIKAEDPLPDIRNGLPPEDEAYVSD